MRRGSLNQELDCFVAIAPRKYDKSSVTTSVLKGTIADTKGHNMKTGKVESDLAGKKFS